MKFKVHLFKKYRGNGDQTGEDLISSDVVSEKVPTDFPWNAKEDDPNSKYRYQGCNGMLSIKGQDYEYTPDFENIYIQFNTRMIINWANKEIGFLIPTNVGGNIYDQYSDLTDQFTEDELEGDELSIFI